MKGRISPLDTAPRQRCFMANKRHLCSNSGEGRGNTFPPHPLCTDINLYQRAIQKTIIQATCQLPYSHQKTVQPTGSTLGLSNQKHFLKLSMEIGNWDGEKIRDNDFPGYFIIDYVKIYEKVH